MKYAIIDDFGYMGNYEEKIISIKNAGFDSVFINMRDENKNIIPLNQILDKINVIKKHNLNIEFAHLPIDKRLNSFWTNSPSIEFLDYLDDTVKILSLNNVNLFVIHSYYKNIGVDLNDNIELLLSKLSDIALKYGVKLSIENVDYFYQDKYVLDKINNFNLGFCYDLGHENAFYEENYKKNFLLKNYGENLFCLHIHDNNGFKDSHKLPFSESCSINWKEKLKALKPYLNENISLTLEAKCEKTLDKQQAIKFLHEAIFSLEKINKLLNEDI